MQALIEDLLTYSRTNVADRNFVKTNLNEVSAEVIEELSELIKETKAVIEIDVMCEVEIIPFQIRQLLNNLITNAVKFTKKEVVPTIAITASTGDAADFKNEIAKLTTAKLVKNKQHCRIVVTDNGIGFNPKYRDRIFEVFQRLHVKEDYPGTGIGLAIVKKIVQNHNGIITADSELNKGATFIIYLPIGIN